MKSFILHFITNNHKFKLDSDVDKEKLINNYDKYFRLMCKHKGLVPTLKLHIANIIKASAGCGGCDSGGCDMCGHCSGDCD